MTKSSIASLKTPKKIALLESEYTRMLSNNSEGMFARFPELRSVHSITSGMRCTILDIASHLNRVFKTANQAEDPQTIKNNILEQLRKVNLTLQLYRLFQSNMKNNNNWFNLF